MHYLGTPTHCCLYCCATGPRQPDHSLAAASRQLSFDSGECAREHRRLVDNGMRRTCTYPSDCRSFFYCRRRRRYS
eukprot:COSAG06_NODE_669_length_13222_cov_8.235922_20_plen_76_part_00